MKIFSVKNHFRAIYWQGAPTSLLRNIKMISFSESMATILSAKPCRLNNPNRNLYSTTKQSGLKPHCKPISCNENRVFPVKFSHREIPAMKTGVPAMRTGVPCNENRFFPVWKTSQGKPCSGPVLALYGIAVWINRIFSKSARAISKILLT